MSVRGNIKHFAIAAAMLFFAVGAIAAATDSPMSRSMQQAVRLYQDGKYHDAMDRFMDVLVNGTPAERSIANDYINKINQKMDASESGVSADEYATSVSKDNSGEGSAASSVATPAAVVPAAKPAVKKAAPVYTEDTVSASEEPEPVKPVVKASAKPKAKAPVAQEEPEQDEQSDEVAPPRRTQATSAERKAMMARQIDQKIKAMRRTLLSYLAATSGVQV